MFKLKTSHWLLILIPFTLSMLFGCKPSPEQQAKNEERKKEFCLDNICPGDVMPKYDFKTEASFKRGGRWFIAPKEYSGYGGALAFYWPSKTPMTGLGGKDFPEYGKDYSAVAIELFVKSQPQGKDMYEFVLMDEKNSRIISRDRIASGLEKIVRMPEPGATMDNSVLYIATDLKTEMGNPPVVSCLASTKTCTAGLPWKNDFHVYVRFEQSHSQDWPQIYEEIVRVLNLIKEA